MFTNLFDVDQLEYRCTEGRHSESSRVEVLTSARITAKELKMLAVEVSDRPWNPSPRRESEDRKY